MAAYYNEIEPYCVAWLRNLIAAGLIADGDVDDRSIKEVTADDVRGYTQCHFFAGIGGWSYALRLAGWADSRSVWTGSCPCQPFSSAGKRKGFDDERHLWPTWFDLIRQCQPGALFGEQVANGDGYLWFDAVSADMEYEGCAIGPVDLPACGIGAPDIRNRLWWAAYRYLQRRNGQSVRLCGRRQNEESAEVAGGGEAGGLADANSAGLEKRSGIGGIQQQAMGASTRKAVKRAGYLNGFWRNAEWLWCLDGRYRPTKPGIRPLADGLPGRVDQICAAGNAIVPQAAAAVIRAFMECRP